MIARQLSFVPERVEVVGVADAGLWVSGQDGSHWVTPEGVVQARLARWLQTAFESQGAWYGVDRDLRGSDNGRVCDLPQGRVLFELSNGTHLPAGDRWFVDSTTSASYDSTTYVVRELPSGRVTARVELPDTGHALESSRDTLVVARGGSDTLLEFPLAGGEPRPHARWTDHRLGAAPCLLVGCDDVVVTAVDSDGAHCVLRIPNTGDTPRELLRLPPNDPPRELLRGRRSVLVRSDRGLRSVSDDGHITTLLKGELQWATTMGGRVLASPAGERVRDPFAPRPPRPVLVLPDPALEDAESIQAVRLEPSENLRPAGFSDGHVVFHTVASGPVLVHLDALVEGELRASVVDCATEDGALERAEVIVHSRDLLRLKTAGYPLIDTMTSPLGLMPGDEVLVKLRPGGRGRAGVERLVVRKDGRTIRRVSTGRSLEEPESELTLGLVRRHTG